MTKRFIVLVLLVVFVTPIFTTSGSLSPLLAQTGDSWPQLQHDAWRSGRTEALVGSQLRARWIWFGPDWILRNQNSQPGVATWDDDLASYDGHDLDMPETVPFTFAETMQPVVANDTIFVGDHTMHKVWALSLDDGAVLWEADNPGGTAWSGVATDSVVVFASLLGYVTAWDVDTGQQRWQVDTRRSISSAPLLYEDTIYVGNHGGQVYAIDLTTGDIHWQADTGAPIQGGLAAGENRIYAGNDAMFVFAFDATNGQQLAQSDRLMGQSFRGLWPVVAGDHVVLRTVPVIDIGSEYDLLDVIDGSDGDFGREQATLRAWMQTPTGSLHEHLIALNTADLSKDYIIPNAPVGGVGAPADPPVLTQDDRLVTWWPTYFSTLSRCSFGCADGQDIDLASVDLDTGLGVQFPSTRIATDVETDNTFGMTVDGRDTLYLRQQFRGTKAVNLQTFESYRISAEYRWFDSGGYQATINYAEGSQNGSWDDFVVYTPLTDEQLSGGHVGPAIVPNRLIFTERFAVVVVESF